MSNGKLKIAFVRRGYSPSGGAEAYLKRLASGIVDLGHEVRLIATDDWPSNEWNFGPITRLHSNASIGFADELERHRSEIRCDVLMSLERVWRCDVYRAGDGVHQAWLNRRRKFEMPLQRFVRAANPKHQDLIKLEGSLFRQSGAARVIANSEMVKREIIDFYGYSADKIDIVRNGVPLEKYRFDPALRERSRAELKLKSNEIALLFAGSGWERKGLRFAIEAFELCRDRKLRLLVAGRGDQRGYRPKRFFTEEPVRFDGVHGTIVDVPNDSRALAEAIRFWSDESRRGVARSTNAELASRFDISKNIEETVAVLIQLPASKPSSGGSMTKT